MAIRSSIANGGIYNIIIGTEDNTEVTFKSWNGGGRPFEETITVNRGETFFWYQARGGMCDNDYARGLTGPCTTFDGSVITSDKPVAVMGTADCSWGWDCGACEVLINMPLPTSRWGTEYATMQALQRNIPTTVPLAGNPNCARNPDVSGDYVQVMGPVGTEVLVSNKDGRDVSYTIPVPDWDMGANYGHGQLILEVSATGNDYGFANNYITADQPVQVTQYPKGWQTDANLTADPEACMIAPMDTWKSSYLFAILFKAGATTSNTIGLITADPNPQIELNGNLVNGWTPIANTDLQWARVPTLLNIQTNRIFNLTGEPFGINIVSGAQANSFFTTGGSGDVLEVSQCPNCPLADFDTDDLFYCDGETVQFTDLSRDDDPSGATQIVEWIWDYGDGTVDTFNTSTNPTHLFPGPGSYTITLTVTNNNMDPEPCSQSVTKSIRIGAGIVVDAGDDQSACTGQSIQLGGSPTALGGVPPLTYTWTPAGGINDPSIANPELTVNGTQSYTVTVRDSIGCELSDMVEITEIPTDSVFLSPVGDPVICDGESFEFRVGASLGNAEPYDISLTFGGNTETFTNLRRDDIITINPNGTVNVNLSNVTGSIASSCIRFSNEPINVRMRPVPTVSIIDADSPVCAGEDVEIEVNITGDKPIDMTYTFDGQTDVEGNINNSVFTFTINPTSSSVFEITELAYSDDPACPTLVSESINIEVVQPKNAGTDNQLDLCVTDDLVDLTPLLGADADNGTWEDTDNSGALDASGNFDPERAGEGAFTVKHSISDNAPCPAEEAIIMLTVNGTPQASNIVDTCNVDLQGYVVRFDISGGDPDSYTSPDGTITGGGATRRFVSNQTYDNQTTYNISVSDKFNCGALNLSNFVNCGCKSKSGSMSNSLQESCETNNITVDAATGSVLLPGDTLLYVLHEGNGNQIVNPITEQDSLEFSFIPGLIAYGQRYYVSAVVGPVLNNSVDYSSECIGISQGQPVRWYQQVTATASITNPDVCDGDDLSISLSFSGNGPYSVDVSGNNSPLVNYTNLSSNANINYPINNSDQIYIHNIGDKFCNNPDTILTQQINIRRAPSLVSNPGTTCDALQENFVLSFALQDNDINSTQVIAIDGSGTYDPASNTFTSNSMPSGSTYHFQVRDQFNCGTLDIQGQFTCACVSDAGNIIANTYEACRNNNIVLQHDGQETLDGNDVLTYAVHSNPTYNESEVLAFFDSPTLSFTPSFQAETTYYVSVIAGSDSNGDNLVDLSDPCLSVSTNSVPIIFFNLPTAVFAAPASATVCEGSSVSLPINVSGRAPFTIETQDAFGNTTTQTVNAASMASLTFTPTDTSFVDIVQVTDANGCVSNVPNRANLFTLSAPSASISTTTPSICDGESLEIVVDLDGVAPFNFDLVDDQGNAFTGTNVTSNQFTQTVSPNSSRRYEVINLSDDACVGQNSNPLDVTVNTLPSAVISGDATICDGENLFLSVSVTGGTGPYDIEFDDGSGTFSTQVNGNNNSVPFNYSVGSNTYNIMTVTDNSSLQCVGQGNFTDVFVHALPEGDLLGNYTVCEGDQIEIDVDLTGTANFDFELEDDLGQRFGPFTFNTNTGTVPLEFNTSGERQLRIVTLADNFCPNPNPAGDLATVDVLDVPKFIIEGNNTIGCVPLAAEVINRTDISDILSCTWTLNGALVENTSCDGFTKVFSNEADLDLNLSIVYNSGCVRDTTLSSFIQAYPLPTPDFTFNPSRPTIINNVVNFRNTSLGSSSATWDIEEFSTDSGNSIQVVFPDDTVRNYVVKLRAISPNGCIDSISKQLRLDGELIIYVPNAFTPNNDNINDGFGPVVNGTDDFINSYQFLVYNRWGEELFSSNTVGETWDGTFKGELVQPGVYAYRVIVRSRYDAERRVETGNFTVLR